MFFTKRALAAILFVIAITPCPVLAAAKISTANMGTFSRISFGWDKTTPMTFSVSGNKVTLSFANPVGAEVGGVASRLRPHVRGITRMPDGKRVIITLDKPYHVRQFLSGNTNGIDIITRQQEDVADDNIMRIKPPQSDPNKTASVYSTKKEITPKPPVNTPEKIATKAITKNTTSTPMLTTKAAPAETIKPSKIPEKESIPSEDVKIAAPTVNKTASKVAAADEISPNTKEIQKPAEKETPIKQTVKAEPPKEASATPPEQHVSTLLIGSVKDAKNPTLEFMWTSRVALATFARGQDIWVVFSKYAKVNEANLITALPTGITHAEVFGLAGATVIKLSASKTVYPLAEHVKGTYFWRIGFLPTPQKKAEITYTAESRSAKTKTASVLFNALDAASAVKFYDPTFGDKLLVMPLYDSAHHISTPRRFASGEILITGQGIAARSDDDSTVLQRTPAGVILTSAHSLPIQKKMPLLPGQKTVGMLDPASSHLVIAHARYFNAAQSFAESRARIGRELAATNKRTRPIKLHELAGMYVSEGFGHEAVKILNDLETEYPNYYAKERLAIMRAAAYFMADRIPEAIDAFSKGKFTADDKEARMWKDVLEIFKPRPIVPTLAAENSGASDTKANEIPKAPAPPKAMLDLLSFQDDVLRYYPPRVRQKLSIIGADQYIQQKRYAQAITLFDNLSIDGILEPIQPFAEYMVGRIAAEKGDSKRALEIWQKLIERDEDPYITARADFASISLSFADGKLDITQAIKRLESLRLDWRYDALEQEILRFLGQLYVDNKQYDMALRVWKELLNYYPGTPDSLELTVIMGDLFMKLYTEGLADDLPPLKSLSLFYEFRDLIPVDERGDIIVRKLAERLANVDLLDRAIALLAHQIKSRSEGLDRSKLGTQLALLYIINNQPNEALQTLEASSYGDFSGELVQLRNQLTAQALHKLKEYTSALQALQGDTSKKAAKLRMEILWDMEDWPNIINAAEDALAIRKDFSAPLTKTEQNFLLRLALAYSFENNTVQLQYLRDYYLGLIPDESDSKEVFDYLTNYTKPLSPKDISVIAAQINGTETFLSDLRKSLANGNVSSMLAEESAKKSKEDNTVPDNTDAPEKAEQ